MLRILPTDGTQVYLVCLVYLVYLVCQVCQAHESNRWDNGEFFNTISNRGRKIRRFFAFFAIQDAAEMLSASFVRRDPRTAEKGRMMSDMLTMAAGQIGHPMSFFVLMVADDRLIHTARPFHS